MSDVHQRVKASIHEASIFNVLFTGFTDFVAYCYWPVALTAWALLAFLMIRSLIKDPSFQTTPDGPVVRAASIGCAGIFMAAPAFAWPAIAYMGLIMLSFLVFVYAIAGIAWLIKKARPPVHIPQEAEPAKERLPLVRRLASRFQRKPSAIFSPGPLASDVSTARRNPPAVDSTSVSTNVIPENIAAYPPSVVESHHFVSNPQLPLPPTSPTWDKPMRVLWPESKLRSEGVVPQLPSSATVTREISPLQIMSLNHRIMQAELYELIVAATSSTLGAIVECEVGGIDIRVWTPDQTIYVEIKTEEPARLAIRLALGQLLEYTWNDRESQSHRKSLLLIIAPDECNIETAVYLADLKDRYQLPLKYIAYKLGSRNFSWDEAIR